jgi:hypothetical protein
MNNLNFDAMTTKELRAYVLEHRDNQQAINALANRIEATGTRLESPDQLPVIIERKQQQLSQQQ